MVTVVDRAGMEMTGSLRCPAGPGRTAVGCSWVWARTWESRISREVEGVGPAEGRGVRRGGAVHLGTARLEGLRYKQVKTQNLLLCLVSPVL